MLYSYVVFVVGHSEVSAWYKRNEPVEKAAYHMLLGADVLLLVRTTQKVTMHTAS